MGKTTGRARQKAPAAKREGQRQLDEAVDMTFPASDPIATGRATGTEPPARPVNRQAPVITREEIERAAAKGGRRRQRNSAKL
jgi:hypothetical protein